MKKLINYFFYKYRNFLVYIYFTSNPKKINPIAYLINYKKKKAKKFIENIKELKNHLNLLNDKSNSTGVQYKDHQLLYESVLKYKPKYVLELGSGVSSTTIAYALKINKELHNIDGKLISLEENSFYHNEVKNITDKFLSKFIDFRFSKRKTRTFNKIHGCYYDQIPNYDYDIIFIDGPTLRGIPDDFSQNKAFNADILNILSNNNYVPKLIILDKRIDTMWSLKKCLPETTIKYYPTLGISKIFYSKGQKIYN